MTEAATITIQPHLMDGFPYRSLTERYCKKGEHWVETADDSRRWYYHTCPECKADYRRQYVAAHQEQVAGYAKKYNSNPDNKEKIRGHKKRYRDANPDKDKKRPEYMAEYHAANREERNRRARERAQSKRDLAGGFSNLTYQYGITREEWLGIYEAQDGKCAIEVCRKPLTPRPSPNTHTDHDHATGKVRGILCRQCNLWMAALDVAGWVKAAEKYLENP